MQVKAFLADPSAFAVTSAPEAAAETSGTAAKEEAKPAEEEEEEEEDEVCPSCMTIKSIINLFIL